MKYSASNPRSLEPSQWAWLRLGLAVWLGVGMLGCHEDTGPKPFDLPVYFTCDIRGRLVPCGCFTGQYGGMTRLKTVLDAQPSEPALRLDVGDAVAGAEDYHVIEYRYLLEAFAGLNYDILNLGAREAALSAEVLRPFRTNSPVPLISANLTDAATGTLIFEPYRILQRGGYRLAIVGVVDPEGLRETLGEGLAVEGMETALSRILPELSSQADRIVLLAFTDELGMERLARQFYEIDVILGGRVAQPAQELAQENRSLIYFTTNESRALGILRLRLTPNQRPEALTHEIYLLHDQIPEDTSLQTLAEAYREEVRHTSLAVDDPAHLEAGMIPGVRTVARYVGSDACLECHPTSAEVWEKSGHSRAFQTLLVRGADADPKCIGCHTIGFGLPTGYRRELAGERLVDVGCESCHGPGSLHVRQQEDDATVQFDFRPLEAGDCRKCHHGEFSRPFDWDEFWPSIAHGNEN